MNKLKVVAIGVIALVAVIVVLQNTQSVETKLLFVTLKLPDAALLFATLIIGFAIGVLTAGHVVSNAKRPLSPQESPNNTPRPMQRAHPSIYSPNVDVRSDLQRATAARQAEA